MKLPFDPVAFLQEYKDYFILAGLAVAAAFIMEFLPRETDIFELGQNVKYVYLGVIGLSGYLFFSNYFNKSATAPQFRRTVDPRILSTSSFQKSLQQQYGPTPPTRQQTPGYVSEAPPQQPPIRRNGTSEVWNKFNRK